MYKKPIAIILSAALVWSCLATTATAAVIATPEAVSMQAHQQRLDQVQVVLARAEVQQAMIDMGVDPAQARMRVASLNQQELAQLQGHLETLPAGGILGLIGAVFVVLLILEVTGVVDIFKKV
jgi:hypothetical protein